eukprot:scaffold48360_cov60-Phaeocystis_antarctica.AAC.4
MAAGRRVIWTYPRPAPAEEGCPGKEDGNKKEYSSAYRGPDVRRLTPVEDACGYIDPPGCGATARSVLGWYRDPVSWCPRDVGW